MTSQTSREQREALIGSDKMQGAVVYCSDGSRIGRIESVMIDSASGKIAYAVMSCSGGGAHDRYPLPWSLLSHNLALDGYEANITDEQLKGAPKYCRDEPSDWTSREQGQMLNDYYNVAPM
jgi:hypothetical protein